MYSAFGKYSDPLTFSKCYYVTVLFNKKKSLINLHTTHHNDKAKTDF